MLTKRYRKALVPFVLYGWKAEQYPGRKDYLLDGDYRFPWRVADSTIHFLMDEGYLEHYCIGVPTYRATSKAKALKCMDCHHGKRHENHHADNYTICETCDGIGIKSI